jgi:hypothetical protein
MRLCVLFSAFYFLLENGKFQRTMCVHKVLLQTRQECYRNLQDVLIAFPTGNNQQNSSDCFSKFKSGVISVNDIQHSGKSIHEQNKQNAA